MTSPEIVETLKKEANNNPVVNAVFHVFALRKRARSTVNVTSLYYAMKKEGFNYEPKEYIPVLNLLANLGFGQIELDRKGKVKGLKNVKATLQSIGQAACGSASKLEITKQRAKFVKLPPAIEVIKENKKTELNLQLNINGKPIHISVPNNFTKDEIVLLLDKLHIA